MVIVQPKVVFKLNFAGSCLRTYLQAPNLTILEIENVLLFDWRVIMVCFKHLRDNLVVELLVDRVEAESFGER